MELWGTGFNAWSQLEFDSAGDDPKDLPCFTKILEDKSIEVLGLHTTCTVVNLPTGLKFAGRRDEFVKVAFDLFRSEADMWPVAITGNGTVAGRISGIIKQYDSLVHDDEVWDLDGKDFQVFKDFDDIIIDVAANFTVFTTLTARGTVYTWGDERHIARLGREVSDESPADVPCIVEDLSTLPDKVTRISSGGDLTAALTSSNDVYTWGAGMTTGPVAQLWHDSPTPLDLGEHDFLDVAIGNRHAIVLTTEHRIFVLGRNGSGQLGLGEKRDYPLWTEVTLPLKKKQYVTRVYAGHNNSLFLVEDITE